MYMSLSDAYVFRIIYGQAVLIPVTSEAVSGNLISLNETASKIFQYCDKCNTIEELSDKILSEYVDAEEYRSDMQDFIQKLVDNKILIYKEAEK